MLGNGTLIGLMRLIYAVLFYKNFNQKKSF